MARTALPTDPATGLGDLYQGYAAHWWTSEESTPVGRVGVFFASGNGGQKLFIVPRLQLVVALTSSAYGRGRAHRRAHGMLRSILAAVVLESALRSVTNDFAWLTASAEKVRGGLSIGGVVVRRLVVSREGPARFQPVN